MQLFPEYEDIAALSTAPLFILMLAAPILSRTSETIQKTIWYQLLAWSGSVTMALWSVFIFLSIPVDVFTIIVNQFVAVPFRLVYQVVAVFALVTVILGLIEVFRGPIIREIEIKIAGLKEDLHGFKIAQISDLHVGPTIRKSYVAKVVKKTNSTNPDLIVATGDMADAKGDAIVDHISPFRDLKPKHGIFYVTGNHEYYQGVDGIIREFSKVGFTPLINENRVITVSSTKVMIAGITDPMGRVHRDSHHPSVEAAAITTAQPDLKILLAHRPDAYHEASKHGFDIQFSGHTHAGQYFPFNFLIGFFHRYSRGLYKHENTWVHVNPATGYWGPANRLGVPAEITLITLRRV